MRKENLLIVCVTLLFVINLGTLAFVFFDNGMIRQRGGMNRPEPRKIIVERLQLDPAQREKYSVLIDLHRHQIRIIEDEISATKNKLYLLLNDEQPNQSEKKQLIDALAQLQKKIEETHFKHFEDLKKLCRNDQLQDFKQLTEELSRIFSRPPKPRD